MTLKFSNLFIKDFNVRWLIIIALILVHNAATYASTLSIGNSATQTRTPMNYYYTDTYQGCQMIYTAAELGDFQKSAKITAISFYYENVSTTSAAPSINFSVKMGTTTSSYFTSNSNLLSTSSLTEVANTTIGGWAKKSSGWVTIKLSTPFVYTGGNILIDIRNTAKGSYSSSVYFASSTVSNYMTLSWTSASSSTVSSISSGLRTTARPNIEFTYTLYSELTGEDGITYIHCPEAGTFYELYEAVGTPSKVKVSGYMNGLDFYRLSADHDSANDNFCCYLQHLNYLDLSEVTIEDYVCDINYNPLIDNKYYTTEKNKLSFNFKTFGLETLVLPDNCEYFYTEDADDYFYKHIRNVYTRNRTPFGMTYNNVDGVLHVPSGTKKAWQEQLTNGTNNGNSDNYVNSCVVADTPVKTLNNSTYLTSTEIANVDVLVVNSNVSAPFFKTLNSMPQLNKLVINGSIVAYTGSNGTLNEYTTYGKNEIPQNAFKDNKTLQTIKLKYCNKIADCAFQNAINLRSFIKEMPYDEHTSIIGNYAFDGCVNLSKVENPSNYDCEYGFTSIGDFAFRNTRLSHIALSSICESIDEWGDNYDDNYIPFTHVGKNPFFGVYSSHGVKSYYYFLDDTYGSSYNEGPFSLDEDCNSWSGGVCLLIKDSTLYASAFRYISYGYGNYEGKYQIGSKIKHVADYGISDVWLEELTINANLETVGEAFLYKCHDLKAIKGTSAAFVAKDSVLYNFAMDTLVKYPSNHPFTEFHVPLTVKYIDDWAFEGLKNLKALYISNKTPINIGENVFENVDFENFTLYIPYGAKNAYEADGKWGVITNIVETDFPDIPEDIPDGLLGDINGDDEVNVGDFATLVNAIFDPENTDKAKYARADVNKDGEVNVGDFAALVNVIFGGSSNAAPKKAAATRATTGEHRLYIEPFNIAPGERAEIAVLMENTGDKFSQMQFDLTLPEGISIVQEFDEELFGDVPLIKHGSRTSSKAYDITCRPEGDGVKIMCATENINAYFLRESGDVLLITVEAAADLAFGTYELTISNSVLARQDDSTYKPASETAEITVCDLTGIDSIEAEDGTAEIYDIYGRRVTEPVKGGVYIVNGKKVVVE